MRGIENNNEIMFSAARQGGWKVFGGLTVAGAVGGYYCSPFSILRYVTEHELPVRGTLEAAEYSSEIEKDLNKLPVVRQLKQESRYKQIRSWENMKDKGRLEKLFTAGTLRTPGGLSIEPMVFVDTEEKSSVAIVHCGRLLTGFPLIVHGGVLGTLLDEALARIAFLSFKVPVGVTANLDINYKAPTLAHQFLVITTWTEEVKEGRKALVAGSVQTTHGKELVRAKATFVSPKKLNLEKSLDYF